jgi:hypothetical protein
MYVCMYVCMHASMYACHVSCHCFPKWKNFRGYTGTYSNGEFYFFTELLKKWYVIKLLGSCTIGAIHWMTINICIYETPYLYLPSERLAVNTRGICDAVFACIAEIWICPVHPLVFSFVWKTVVVPSRKCERDTNNYHFHFIYITVFFNHAFWNGCV